jgi:FlaA1/EpsC-like NDP-sugar epimerase
MIGVPIGEKLHEILISEMEAGFATSAGTHFVIRPTGPRKNGQSLRYASNDNPFNDHEESRSMERDLGRPLSGVLDAR